MTENMKKQNYRDSAPLASPQYFSIESLENRLFLSHRQKLEVNILNARTVLLPKFPK